MAVFKHSEFCDIHLSFNRRKGKLTKKLGREKGWRRTWGSSVGWSMLSPLRRWLCEKRLLPCRWGGAQPHSRTLLYFSGFQLYWWILCKSSQARLQQQIAELEQKLDTVVLVMGDTGLLKPPGYPHQDSDIIPAGAVCVCVLAVNNKVSKVSHKFIVTKCRSYKKKQKNRLTISKRIRERKKMTNFACPGLLSTLLSHETEVLNVLFDTYFV